MQIVWDQWNLLFEEGGMCALHDIAATCLWVFGTSRGQRDYCMVHSTHRKIPNMNFCELQSACETIFVWVR